MEKLSFFFSPTTTEHSGYSLESPLPIIPPKPKSYEKGLTEPPAGGVPRVYSCPLCNDVFQTEDDIGKHLEKVAH